MNLDIWVWPAIEYATEAQIKLVRCVYVCIEVQ